MSSKRLLSRVPSARFISTARLVGHVLRFHKKSQDGSAKCDVLETENNTDAVYGVIYDIAVAHKAELDRIEGVGAGYEKKTVELVASSGEIFRAYTYYATLIDTTIKPYHWYKHHVIAGALENSLPGFYLDKLDKIDSMEDTDSQRHATEMAIYQDSSKATRSLSRKR
jgi:gamma-glutamylcyclotransferase (GGCT)/AIG2-like uncharacterized protein YtfP